MDGSKRVKHDRKARGRRAIIRPSKADIQYQQILALFEELKAGSPYLRRLMVGTNGRLLLIETASIDWIEAQGNYVRVHSGKTQHVLRKRIGYLESSLDPQVFLRVNRSAIVNIDRVRELAASVAWRLSPRTGCWHGTRPKSQLPTKLRKASR